MRRGALLMLQQGYSFTSLVSHERLVEQNKADYYLALNKTQKTWKNDEEDLSPWLLFSFNIFHQQAIKAQVVLESDQFEYLLSEKQLQFWQWAKQKGAFSRKTAIDEQGFPPKTIEDMTKKLLDMGKFERLGQGRATRYRVIG